MTKEKILLIVGCSNASGSEIDGTDDSKFNRHKSFGNVLAGKVGRNPVNIASNGLTNQGIARTVLEWFDRNYDAQTMDVMVLCAWTESLRMEMATNWPVPYDQLNPSCEFVSMTAKHFFRVNLGYKGAFPEEEEMIAKCHEFMSYPLSGAYLETISASMVLLLQYYFKLHNIEYLMCNTMYMFSRSNHTRFWLDQIDQTYYYNMLGMENSFYWKYKELGYKNAKAKYWHHDEVPHRMFANELFEFYNKYALNDIINDD